MSSMDDGNLIPRRTFSFVFFQTGMLPPVIHCPQGPLAYQGLSHTISRSGKFPWTLGLCSLTGPVAFHLPTNALH